MHTPRFRVSFNDMNEPTQINGEGKMKYRLTMLFDLAAIAKDPEQQKLWDGMLGGINAAMIKKFGAIQKEGTYRKPFIDGNTCTDKTSGNIYGGHEDMVVLRTASDLQPGLVYADRTPIINAGDFYSGCYAHATVSAFAWQHPMNGKGVSFGLGNVQKMADGEPLGGRTSVEDDFGAIETAVNEASNVSLFS